MNTKLNLIYDLFSYISNDDNTSSNDPSTQQRIASNPKTSVWVSASAGTGKTKILVDRLLRLLLDGVNVDNILCITYSKAAAQEMPGRNPGREAIAAGWALRFHRPVARFVGRL